MRILCNKEKIGKYLEAKGYFEIILTKSYPTLPQLIDKVSLRVEINY